VLTHRKTAVPFALPFVGLVAHVLLMSGAATRT